MYNEQQILKKCQEFAKIHFNIEFSDKVRLSSKMTSSFGSCNYTKIIKGNTIEYKIKELVFANRIFQDPKYDNNTLDKIILHELAHYYLLKQNYNAGHNKDFKALCSRIGGDLGYAASEIKEYGFKKYYIITCSKCSQYVCVRTNRPTEKLMTQYHSRCCKASLTNIGQHEVQLENINESIRKIIQQYQKK